MQWLKASEYLQFGRFRAFSWVSFDLIQRANSTPAVPLLCSELIVPIQRGVWQLSLCKIMIPNSRKEERFDSHSNYYNLSNRWITSCFAAIVELFHACSDQTELFPAASRFLLQLNGLYQPCLFLEEMDMVGTNRPFSISVWRKERQTIDLSARGKQPKFCVPLEIWCLNRKERWYSINKQGRLQLLSRRLLFEKLRRVLHKILYGEAPPRVPHTYHLIHQTEKVTLPYIFYWQMMSLSHTKSRTLILLTAVNAPSFNMNKSLN